MKRQPSKCATCGGILRSKEERASKVCWLCGYVQRRMAELASGANVNGKTG